MKNRVLSLLVGVMSSLVTFASPCSLRQSASYSGTNFTYYLTAQKFATGATPYQIKLEFESIPAGYTLGNSNVYASFPNYQYGYVNFNAQADGKTVLAECDREPSFSGQIAINIGSGRQLNISLPAINWSPCDTEAPTNVQAAYIDGTMFQLQVSAEDDITETVTKFRLTGDVADDTEVYTATDGKITFSLTNLPDCDGTATQKTVQVYAQDDAGNESAEYATVTITVQPGNHGNLAAAATKTAGADNSHNLALGFDGDLTTRTDHIGSNDGDITGAWILLDFGEVIDLRQILIWWETATATDYEFQASFNGTDFVTFMHCVSAPKTYNDDGVNMTYMLNEAIPTRYLRMKANTLYNNAYGMSFYNFEVYSGSCHTPKEEPQMLAAGLEELQMESARIFVSAIDEQTPPSALGYKLEVLSSTTRNVYRYTAEELETGNICKLEGLLPGADYTVNIQAKDEDSNLSDNLKTVKFRTPASTGCILTGGGEGTGYDVNGAIKFPIGYYWTVSVTASAGNNSFTVKTSCTHPGDITVGAIYCAFIKSDTDEQSTYTGPVDIDIKTDEWAGEKTFTPDFLFDWDAGSKTGKLFPHWDKEIVFYIKYECGDGMRYTDRIYYTPSEGCDDWFIIYHNGDAPAGETITESDKTEITSDIHYYRRFDPGEWEPLYLPFEVEAVRVFDSNTKRYETLKPKTKTQEGDYWLRQQVEKVSGENFQSSWYDADDLVPQQNTPYNFRVPSGGYYKNKYIIFDGKPTTVDDEFERGAYPSEDDQYTLYGNNTLQPTTLQKAYKINDDGSYYERQENWTLYPFECYVLAKETTMAKMPRISRWTADDTTTCLTQNATEQSLQALLGSGGRFQNLRLYTLTGQLLYSATNQKTMRAMTTVVQSPQRGAKPP